MDCVRDRGKRYSAMPWECDSPSNAIPSSLRGYLSSWTGILGRWRSLDVLSKDVIERTHTVLDKGGVMISVLLCFRTVNGCFRCRIFKCRALWDVILTGFERRLENRDFLELCGVFFFQDLGFLGKRRFFTGIWKNPLILTFLCSQAVKEHQCQMKELLEASGYLCWTGRYYTFSPAYMYQGIIESPDPENIWKSPEILPWPKGKIHLPTPPPPPPHSLRKTDIPNKRKSCLYYKRSTTQCT